MKDILKRLKGKEIFVGRESGTDRLLAYLSINGQKKVFRIGDPGSVSKTVSRAIPTQDKAHASIKIDDNENIIITNLKMENVTFINDAPIVSKRISLQDKIELGGDHYQLPFELVLKSIFKDSQLPKTYSIGHLAKVWEDFKLGQKKIKERQRKINLIRSGCGLFTMCAMPTIFFLGPVGYLLTGIGVLGNAYSFWGMRKSDPEEERENLVEILEQKYVCPNPECNRYFGQIKYTMLKNQYHLSCPYCKSKFEE